MTGGFAILAGAEGADGGHPHYAPTSTLRSISPCHSAYSAALTSHANPTIHTIGSPTIRTLQSPRAWRAHQTAAWASEECSIPHSVEHFRGQMFVSVYVDAFCDPSRQSCPKRAKGPTSQAWRRRKSSLLVVPKSRWRGWREYMPLAGGLYFARKDTSAVTSLLYPRNTKSGNPKAPGWR